MLETLVKEIHIPLSRALKTDVLSKGNTQAPRLPYVYFDIVSENVGNVHNRLSSEEVFKAHDRIIDRQTIYQGMARVSYVVQSRSGDTEGFNLARSLASWFRSNKTLFDIIGWGIVFENGDIESNEENITDFWEKSYKLDVIYYYAIKEASSIESIETAEVSQI